MSDEVVANSQSVETTPVEQVTPVPETPPVVVVQTPSQDPVVVPLTPVPSAPVVESAPVIQQPTPVSQATPPVVLSADASIVAELLSGYKATFQVKHPTDTTAWKSAEFFSAAIERVLKSKSEDVFQVAWDFFIDNKDGILRENSGLRGSESLEKKTKLRLDITYTLFRKATNGINVADNAYVNADVVSSVVKNPNLILFLQEKAKRIGLSSKR